MITKNTTKNRYSELKVITLFVISWSLCFIVPHFQQTFSIYLVIIQLCIALALSFTLYRVLLLDNNRRININPFFILIFPIFYITSMILTLSDKDKFYFFVNRFGAGSMYENNKVYLFSDLTHLTSASSCSVPVEIGVSICDPFSRVFNQNPHIVELMKILGFSNLFIAGFTSTILFFVVMLIIYFKQYLNTMTFILVLLSPPIMLALDRGNEIVTLMLLLPGLYLIKRNSFLEIFGVLLLSLATVFKLWPIVLLISLLIFLWNQLNIISKVLIFMTLLYWLIYADNALDMLESTQKGNPFGLSLGLKHYLNGSIPWSILLIFLLAILISTMFVITKFKILSNIRYNNSLDLFLFNSLILTYFAVWITGDSYIYRLILLIPTLIFLRKVFDQTPACSAMETLLIATMLTSKLTITTVMTSIVAMTFAIILIHQAWTLKGLRLIK